MWYLVRLAFAGIVLVSTVFGREFPCFTDVTSRVGIDFQHVGGSLEKRILVEEMSGGVVFFDYDQDDRLDLYLVNGTTLNHYRGRAGSEETVLSNRLYQNQGEKSFVDVTEESGAGDTSWGMGACAGDYDNDGDVDLYVTNYGPNVLYQNNGDGTFFKATELARVGDPGWGTGCAFGDYDRDGWLDLYLANYAEIDLEAPPQPCHYYEGLKAPCSPKGLPGQSDRLYRNRGDGTFEDVSEKSGIGDDYYGFGVTFADFNDDGFPDVFVANDVTPNLLYFNQGNGTFKEVGIRSGAALSLDGVSQAGMGIAVADYDNDGLSDIYVTHFSGDYSTLYHNDGRGFFSDVTVKTGLAQLSMPFVSWGTGFFDFDNDGFKDLFVASGHVVPNVGSAVPGLAYAQRSQILRNVGGQRFEEVLSPWCQGSNLEKVSRGTAFGDYDNDGDVDILVSNLDDQPTLLRNDGGNQNGFLQVRVLTEAGPRDAIGAKITVRTELKEQTRQILSGASYLSQSDFRAHFGLGEEKSVDLWIRWPNGREERWVNLEANRLVVLRQGEGQSVEDTHQQGTRETAKGNSTLYQD